MYVSVHCCVSYSSIPDCIIFANNFDITWHNTFMQSAATQLLLQVPESLLSTNFSWFSKYSKLSLAWEAVTVMIKIFLFWLWFIYCEFGFDSIVSHHGLLYCLNQGFFIPSWVTCFALLVRTQRPRGPTESYVSIKDNLPIVCLESETRSHLHSNLLSLLILSVFHT